jgi:hypothetical protein
MTAATLLAEHTQALAAFPALAATVQCQPVIAASGRLGPTLCAQGRLRPVLALGRIVTQCAELEVCYVGDSVCLER